MQRAVHDQMRGMVFDRDAAFRRLARADAVREDDVAEQHLAIVANSA